MKKYRRQMINLEPFTKSGNTYILMFILTFQFLLTSCQDAENSPTEDMGYPAEVKTINSTEKVRQIEYVGIISSNIINYSFITGGRVEKIFVDKNQFVSKGTKLIQLETKPYVLALEASQSQELQASSAYSEANAYFEKLNNANKSGGISGDDFEKAKLDRDVKHKTWEQAKIDIEAKNDALKQTALSAKNDGIISDIIPKIGELVGSGAETVIMHEKGLFAETAVSQKDLDFIQLGSSVKLKIKNQILKGKVSYISPLPDLQTFRHAVKIDFSKNDISKHLTIGLTSKIIFEIGTVTGFWVPINFIANDGYDFVYVVENERMRKKKVQILDFTNDLARVSGLSDNELLITKGAYNIKEGYKVKIVNHEE